MSLYALVRESSKKTSSRYRAQSTTGSNNNPQIDLGTLTKYVPTESITIYITGLSLIPILKSQIPLFAPIIYWFCLACTPLFVLIVYKIEKTEGTVFPWWELFAATLAFAVWGLAINGAPFFESNEYRILFSFIALIISTFFELLNQLFYKIRKVGKVGTGKSKTA